MYASASIVGEVKMELELEDVRGLHNRRLILPPSPQDVLVIQSARTRLEVQHAYLAEVRQLSIGDCKFGLTDTPDVAVEYARTANRQLTVRVLKPATRRTIWKGTCVYDFPT